MADPFAVVMVCLLIVIVLGLVLLVVHLLSWWR